MVAFLAAIAAPVENGTSQTRATTSTEAEPPPAPDPVPDPNPNPPATPGGGGSSGSGSDKSSGSSAGSGSARRSPGGDRTASNTDAVDSSDAATEPGELDTQRDRRPHERRADRRDEEAAAHKPRPTRSRSPREGGNAAGLGIVAHGDASTQADYELFLLCLAGALALMLMLLAAIPAHLLAGVSPTLVERRREIEVVIAAVLWSVLIGLLVARYVAQAG